jgi:hypothetical protein
MVRLGYQARTSTSGDPLRNILRVPGVDERHESSAIDDILRIDPSAIPH